MDGYRLRELKIEVNRECPLRCLHCSSLGGPGAREALDHLRVCALIQEFAAMGGEQVRISGGEPLYYHNLPEILGACRKADLQTAIYTTGIMSNDGYLKPLSGEILDALVKSDVRFVFSLHGASASTHDAITGVRGSFATTLAAIRKVLARRAPVEAHVVPTAMNLRELPELTKLLASLPVGKVSWLRFVPQGRGLQNRDLLQLSWGQTAALHSLKIQLQRLNPNLTLRTGAPFNVLCPESPIPCEAGRSILTIRPDGVVAPCDAFKRFNASDDYANVADHGLADVWAKSTLLTAVRELQETKEDSPCASCPAYRRCNSGCLAQAVIEAGQLRHSRDPACPLVGQEISDREVERVAVR